MEVQATAERTPLSRAHLDELLALAQTGIEGLRKAQDEALAGVILATRNAHKVREFERLMPGVAIAPLPDEAPTPEETGTTYAENALIKARSAAHFTGAAGVRRRLGDRVRGPRRATRRPHRPLRRPGRVRRREPPEAAPRGPGGQRRQVRVRDRLRHARTARSTCSRAPATARSPRSPTARAASATTRCSFRSSSRTARWPSSPTTTRTRSRTAARRLASCWTGSPAEPRERRLDQPVVDELDARHRSGRDRNAVPAGWPPTRRDRKL